MNTRRRIIIYLGALLAGSVLLYLMLIAPRRARDPQRLLTCLPAGGHPLLYVDVQSLREAGVLDAVAGPASVEEPDYKAFVQATGFDYRTQLDAAALYFTPDARFIVVRGRFVASRLAEFARGRGGRCAGELCTVEGSSPERQISWLMLDRDILGVAVSKDPLAATSLARGSRPPEPVPPAPVWLTLPGSALERSDGSLTGASALLGPLGGASRATFAANATREGVEVRLVAPFDDSLRADAAAKRLQEAANQLRSEAEEKDDPAARKGVREVLAGGSFRADRTRVEGLWKIPRGFFEQQEK